MVYKKLLFTCVLTTSNAISSPVEIAELAEEKDRQEKRGQPFKNSMYQRIELDGVYKIQNVSADECVVDISETVTGLSGIIRSRIVRITTKPEDETMIPLFLEIYADKCFINGNLYECRPYLLDTLVLPKSKVILSNYFEKLFKPRIGLAQILDAPDKEDPENPLTASQDLLQKQET